MRRLDINGNYLWLSSGCLPVLLRAEHDMQTSEKLFSMEFTLSFKFHYENDNARAAFLLSAEQRYIT